MSISRIHQLIPNPTDTWEQFERYAHRDLTHLDPMQAWSEAHLIEQRIAALAFAGERGRCITVVDGEPVYTIDWLQRRLSRLRSHLRRAAA